MRRLTVLQRARLYEIRNYVPRNDIPGPSFMKASLTDKALLKRGLIETYVHKQPFGGNTVLSRTWIEFTLCRITEAGEYNYGAEAAQAKKSKPRSKRNQSA